MSDQHGRPVMQSLLPAMLQPAPSENLNPEILKHLMVNTARSKPHTTAVADSASNKRGKASADNTPLYVEGAPILSCFGSR